MSDPLHQKRWQGFIRKKKAMVSVSLTDAIERIKKLVLPVIEDIQKGDIPPKKWSPEKEGWFIA